ncbi:hydrogen peroxide-inducible hic-5 [Fusarium albosuccineum]|uniref:Hydrogen peroxide-inducible hic-5 n=1 Tax=Fusarium albosuccineum TaxID=1237068 RepID=A0A8H4L5P0_9HYPO|nr:hydrogen peroxide-inducible hic-5 [Fusarium albosuccineum]
MGKTSETKSRKVTPPSPSYMTNDQFANYLQELRSNRVARPGGARPQPAGARPAPSRSSFRSSTGRFSPDVASQPDSLPGDERVPSPSKNPSIAAGSVASRYSTVSRQSYAKPLKPSEVVPSATYIERGQRWMEKEEASSLRDAMEEMDLRKGTKSPAQETPVQETPDDDTRIYNAALDEAAELVWQHQHGTPSPRPDGPYRYRSHLRKNSYAHARTASVGGTRSFSGSSSESEGNGREGRPSLDHNQSGEQSNRKSKSYGSIGRSGKFSEQRRQASLKRNISGEVERPFSGDQIWEEPEASNAKKTSASGRASPEKLSSRAQNPMNRVRFESPKGEAAKTKPLERVEIHRNPPTRSRNPLYTRNPTGESSSPVDDNVERKNGMEVRSDDIRAATSMKLKDRSPKLPEPTAVSDSPGRPIVSFDADWKAPDESTDASPDRSIPAATSSSSSSSFQPEVQPMEIPSIVVAEESTQMSRASPAANIPSICVAGADDSPRGSVPSINIPTIAVDEAPDSNNSSIPTIVTPDDNKPASRTRPLPTPAGRGLPRHAQRPRGHWSPAPGSSRRATTICHECGFPIEGRFVALAGSNERFHPHCFSCYSCGTNLQAMEISPEPDHVRQERIDRIRRRAAGEILDEEPGKTMAEDGDDRLRFFCHLDWHELFAPRCKHCQTPILGEHIVALGAHWHYGHFFCAECGDPFEHGMTHIEKDGYAWCINCQTKRTERRAPKCRKCRTAVIGQYIQALGGEWHEHCFRCAECQGGFDDGQIFTKHVPEGTIVLCTGCRARELKA